MNFQHTEVICMVPDKEQSSAGSFFGILRIRNKDTRMSSITYSVIHTIINQFKNTPKYVKSIIFIKPG